MFFNFLILKYNTINTKTEYMKAAFCYLHILPLPH